jgi:tetratricopeptide (TPR) repeat protein
VPPLRHAQWAIFVFVICGSLTLAQARPQNLDDYFNRAREMEKGEDYAGAERIYQDAAAKFPNQPEILKRLGVVYQTELKFQESISTFQQVLQGAPQYPEVNFYMGLSYFGLNQPDKAIQAFDKELEANPKYRRARYYEAQAYQSLGRSADALRQYEILLDQDPNDKRALYNLIRFLKTATIAAINQLGNIDPDSDFMLVLKAEGYATEQKYPEAIEDYKEAIRKSPDFPGLHFALGEVYYNSGDFAGSEGELRLALREDPNHIKANYYLADVLLKNDKMPEAIPHLEIVVSGDPNFMMGYFLLAKCYAQQGKLQEAVKLLEKAAELEPHDKNVHYQLSQVYQKLNQPDKAREQLQIFQKLYAEEREQKAKRLEELHERTARSKESQ